MHLMTPINDTAA